MTGAFKPGTPDSSSRSTPATSQSGRTTSPPQGLTSRAVTPHAPKAGNLPFDAPNGTSSDEGLNNGSVTPQSPQQSPAVSTPLPPPLSSPATPDTAVSLPPPSPTTATHSPGGTATSTQDTPPASASCPPQLSPNLESSSRRSPPSNGGAYKGMQQQQTAPMMNGTSGLANSNGSIMPQGHIPFPQHLLQQQQIMGGIMQGALPPNMPPPPNHNRMPPIPSAPFPPAFMRPPTSHHTVPTHRNLVPEESPEALLFNKIVGGGQFPAMNTRPFFQQEAANVRNPAMMYHRDPALEGIKSEPEPILN